MPKEAAHWVIAQRVMERLADGSVADAVRRHPNCLYLGAIFHDVGYYSRGAGGHGLEAFADRLHGARGEDTNQILRQLSAALAQSRAKPWLTSFLVGVVTHIVADRQLHPLVYYFTGNYYDQDPARQKRAAEAHRRLESLIDLRLCNDLAGVKHFSLRRILQGLEVPVADLVAEVRDHSGSDLAPPSAADLLDALRFFSKVQWLVRRPFMVQVLDLPLRLSPANRANLRSLTYFTELEPYTDLLAPPVEYSNPFSGESCRQSLADAIEAIVDASVGLCTGLPGSLHGLPHGESLEVRIASAATAEARYFHPYVLAQDYARINNFEMLQHSA